jgi:hypothetical protein
LGTFVPHFSGMKKARIENHLRRAVICECQTLRLWPKRTVAPYSVELAFWLGMQCNGLESVNQRLAATWIAILF